MGRYFSGGALYVFFFVDSINTYNDILSGGIESESDEMIDVHACSMSERSERFNQLSFLLSFPFWA